MQFPKLNIITKLRLPQNSLLRITCIAGIFLLVFIGIISIAVSKSSSPEKAFYRLLGEYDRQYELVSGAAGTGVPDEQETERLETMLNRLEKKAGSAESLLSVLKRRRQLAYINPRYLAAYRQSAREAAAAYPHSDVLAAIAAAAIVQGTAITKEADAELREYLPVLNYPRMEFFRLCLHVLLGSLQNPQKALDALPEDFSSIMAVPYTFAGRQDIAINMAVLKVIRAESATVEVQDMLGAYSSGGSFEGVIPPVYVLNFAAEYFYDFGDPLRSASLFSYIPGNAALMRQADALWLAGYIEAAFNIWRILSQPDLSAFDPDDFHTRALYNMALITEDDDEAARLYQHAAVPLVPDDPASGFSLIRYSRFLAAPDAAAALETAGANDSRPNPGQTLETSRANVLIDLELLKRHSEMRDAGRITGALWQMLERYPDEENLYQWAAWYFIAQRNSGELAILLKTIARHQFEGQWVDSAEAFLRLSEGDVDEAERLFLLLAAKGTSDKTLTEDAEWDASAVAAANLGRIYESRRAPTRALEYYQKAAELAATEEDASRIQLRIAFCLRMLGRFDECRRALEYALELNPDNLSAQLEINRLEMR